MSAARKPEMTRGDAYKLRPGDKITGREPGRVGYGRTGIVVAVTRRAGVLMRDRHGIERWFPWSRVKLLERAPRPVAETSDLSDAELAECADVGGIPE